MMLAKEEFAMPTSAPSQLTDFKKKQEQPDNKDRTLFCINIDKKCSEDILYELFLQAGPIEQIKRKEDKNGNLICLITYMHAVSCDYAINIFNGISLFGMALKVQLSQLPGAPRRQSTNNYQNIGRERDNSYQRDQRDPRETRRQVSYDHMTPTESPTDNRSLNSLMVRQFSEFGTGSSFANPYSEGLPINNRSMANSFENNDHNGHQSRRNNNNFNNGNRGYSNDNRGGDVWRNQSNNGRNNNNGGYSQQHSNQRNGSYDHRNQSRDSHNRGSKDRSRSPHEQRRQQQQQRNRY